MLTNDVVELPGPDFALLYIINVILVNVDVSQTVDTNNSRHSAGLRHRIFIMFTCQLQM